MKAFTALSGKWNDFQSLIGAGLQAGGTIEADFKKYLESPAGRIERAWTRASNALQAAVTADRVEKIADATEAFARALGFVVDHAQQVITLIGAAKLAQFALATNRWADAMGGVGGAIGDAGGKLRGLNSDVGRLSGALAKSVSYAGGLVGALTAGWEAGKLLVDAMGWFEDKTKTVATTDDPRERASAAQRKREKGEETVQRRK